MRSDKEGTRFNYMSPSDPKVESEIAKPQVMPEDGGAYSVTHSAVL